ncbi:hypothetical protein OHB41_10295 [Streptomyces sp. NBC_01571]|uniref:hypothetical protein n=1 Tax=Streptomyces sp. NBC_01571 TaxID=2975883 RepID=UPI00224CEFA4|nr:hypothetical protein [Streptomyces sp. NBC_01571]MCX4573564.1 hypothetical protein [Streptomyces sp. NBC_01571]
MNDFFAAARRLRLGADLFDRHGRHRNRDLNGIVAGGFRTAADAFEDTVPCIPPLGDLASVSGELARRDFELRNRRTVLLRGGSLGSPDETASWALRALATIHYSHERLAAEVKTDNTKPGNKGRPLVQLLPAARTAPDHRDA